MKDRNGADIQIGDSVFVLPDPKSGSKVSGKGFVRAIEAVPWGRGKNKVCARIDNGPKIERGDNWTWSAWVESVRIELLTERGAQ